MIAGGNIMNNDLKKIALVIDPRFPVPSVNGGAVEELLTILAEQNEIYKRAYFEIYCLYDKKAKKISDEWNFCKMRYYSSHPFFYRLIDFIPRKVFHKSMYPNGLYYPYVIRRLLRRKYDYVVAENKGYVHEFCELKKKYNSSQLIYHIHMHDLADSVSKHNFNRVIGVSEYVTNEWLRSAKPEVCIGRTVKNCVKTERFQQRISSEEKNALRQSLGLKADDFIVLFAGRIVEGKGVLELAKAVVQSKYPNIKLVIAGGNKHADAKMDKYESELDKVVKTSNKIIRVGYIDNTELPKYYQMADIQCAPSLYEEAAGLIVIEGMLSGLPLVITNSGGMVEYVNTDCAVIIDKADDILEKSDRHELIDALTNAIEDLYLHPERREKMSKFGKEYGKQFSPERFYNEFIDAVLS